MSRSCLGRKQRIESTRSVPVSNRPWFPTRPQASCSPGDKGLHRVGSGRTEQFWPRLGFAWDVFGTARLRCAPATASSSKASMPTRWRRERPVRRLSPIFSGHFRPSFGSLGLAAPPGHYGHFGCAKITAYPGYSCPLFPLPINGIYRAELRSPYIQSFNLSIQRSLRSRPGGIHLCREDRHQDRSAADHNPAKFVTPDHRRRAPAQYE